MRVSYDPSSGRILGFYSADIDYGINEPVNYITIDNLLYTKIRTAPNLYAVDLTTLEIIDYEDPLVAFQMRLSKKISEISAACDIFISQLRGKYSSMEVESWPKQEQGAEDIVSGNLLTVDAQFVISMALHRGVPYTQLADRILANVAEANGIVSKALGHMQKLQDTAAAIDPLAPDAKEQLEKIQWNTNFLN